MPPKMSLAAQNLKTGADALGTTEIESESAKHENETRCPRYLRKLVPARKTRKRDPTHLAPPKTSPVPSKMSPGAQNMETGPDALGTAENISGPAKHENGN
jgi:hypothetical protein